MNIFYDKVFFGITSKKRIMMETNNYTTDLQLVSQEYSDEKTSFQTKTKKLLKHFSPKDIWKIKGLIVACLVACFQYVTYLTHFSFAFPATLVLISNN